MDSLIQLRGRGGDVEPMPEQVAPRVEPASPCSVNITRSSTSWHSAHVKVWCSKPVTSIVSSGTTFVRIISAPHTKQRIARTPITIACRPPARGQYRHWPRYAAVKCYVMDHARPGFP